MKKSKVSVEDIKGFCMKMKDISHSNFVKELDGDAKCGGMFSHGGSVAYRDVLDFINKECPYDE